MASLMQNWIAPVALKELPAEYECLEPDHRLAKTTKGQVTCSKGRVTVSLTEARQVQIIDFNNRHKYPFDVTLSDGTTKIRATFEPACTKEFWKHYNRKFTDRTVGGVLEIEVYSLEFDPSLGPLKRLMLRVSEFKLAGNEGSSPFGEPLGIEEQPDIRAVMTKLNNLITRTEGTALPVEGEPPIQSQIDPSDASTSISSAVPTFATQVATVENNHGNNEAANTTHSSSEDLLSILKRSVQPSSKVKKGASRGEMTKEENNIRGTEITSHRRSLSGERITEESSQLDDREVGEHDENLSPQPTPEGTKEQDLLPTGTEPSHAYKMALRENSQESLQLQSQRTSKVLDVLDTANHEDNALQVLVREEGTHEHPFEGLKRIPRSYVRVPEQQRAILERKDSWFQPGNHDTMSYVNNIPPAVLEDLNLFANQVAAPRTRNHANYSRSDDGTTNNDRSSDIDKMDAEAEKSEEHSDIEDTPRDLALEIPDDVPSSLSHPVGEHGPGIIDEEKEGHSTIISYPDVDVEDFDEQVNDDQDEEDEESSEDGISWSSSPQPDRTFKKPSTFESGNAELPSSSEELEMDDELPQQGVRERLITSHTAPSIPKLSDALFPSSSLPSGDELQMEVLHAIDEPVDEHVHEATVSPEASRKPLSTLALNQNTIQVEQTPNTNFRRFEKSTLPVQLSQGRKRRLEDMSSDSIIPNTDTDGPQMSQQSVEFKSQSTSTGKEADSNEGHFLTQASVDDCVEPDQDSVPGHLALVQVEGTQPVVLSPIKSTSEPQGTLNGLERATSPAESPLPQLQPLEGNRMIKTRGPSTGEDSSNSRPESHEQPRGRPRKVLRFANCQFSQEQYASKNTAGIARASRRDFSAQFAEPKAEELDPIANTPLATPQPDSDLTSEFKPVTLSDEPRPSGRGTSAVAESHLTTLLESTPSISAPSIDVLEPQLGYTRNDKTENARQMVADIQPLEDVSIAAERVPEPAEQLMAYGKFIKTYPDYQGSEGQFIAGLVYLEWLVNNKGKNFLRKSLWDDLLRVLADDYVDYVQNYMSSAQKMNCLEFYNELDQDPVFKQLIITPSNLQDYILSYDSEKVEAVRQNFGIGRKPKHEKVILAANSPRSYQLVMSKPLTPDPRKQELNKYLPLDGESAVARQEKSVAPIIQVDDQIATNKPLFFETRSQVQQKQLEGSSSTVEPLPKSLVQPIQDSGKPTASESPPFDTPNQIEAGVLETTPNVIIESIEVSPIKHLKKNSRRVLPWPAQEPTTETLETRSNPSSLHFGELPSYSPPPQLQAQKERLSDSGIRLVPKTRSPMPSRQHEDVFTSPKPSVSNTTPREIKGLQNSRVGRPGGAKAIRDAGSSKKVEFLTGFARKWRLTEMSSRTSTPESKRTRCS